MRKPYISRRAATGVMLVLAALALASVPGDPARAQAPRDAPLVLLDFRVLLQDGEPVLDLKPEDLTLKVNGRVRDIRSLQLIQFPLGDGPVGTAATALPEPFVSNAVADAGRRTLVVLDDESIRPGREQPVQTAVGTALGGMTARDRVGFLTIPRGGANVGFTEDHSQVTKALQTTVGRGPRAETTVEATCRTQSVLESLRGIIETVGREGPTTIVFMSGGLVMPTIIDGASRMSARSTSPMGALCEVRAEHYNAVAAAADEARVTFYGVQVIDDSLGASASDLTAGMEHLAGATGNAIIRLTAEGEAKMARLGRETSAYYMAGFAPEDSERNGQEQRVELAVNRQGATVLTRPSLVVPKATERRVSGNPRDMLRLSRTYRDLPLRAAAYAARDENTQKVRALALFESADPDAKLKAAAVGLFDEKGKLVAQWTAQAEDLAGTPLMTVLPVVPGRYRMRVAALDATGRAGTVDTSIDLELVGVGPLKISTLTLGTSIDGRFAPRLQFSSEQTALGYLEIYGDAPASLAAVFELAASENGPALVSVPASLPPATAQGMRIAYAALPLDKLPIGDILVRAVIGIDGQPVGRVTRTLRKAGR